MPSLDWFPHAAILAAKCNEFEVRMPVKEKEFMLCLRNFYELTDGLLPLSP
jgi:hypothetical protein